MKMTGLPAIHFFTTKTLRAMTIVAVALSAGALFAGGQVFWQEGGISIRDSTADPVGLEIVPDGSGGAIVVWADDRGHPPGPDLYVQRIDSSGAKLWPDSGVAACQPPEAAIWPMAAADGAGGVVMCWEEAFRLNAQRMTGSGTRCWGDSSVVVFDTALMDLDRPRMCSDGRGGCVVLWVMNYNDSIVLRAQYMDSLGQRAWGSRGKRIARDLALYGSEGVADLGSLGFVFTWISDSGEIYAQRLDAAGSAVWTMPVCSGVPVYGYPVIVQMDEGVLVCWTDLRNGDWDVYAQKLSPAGSPLWAQNGVPVCRAAGQQGGNMEYSLESVRAVGLADGGALVAFYDQGRGRTAISCQRLSANGDMMWDSTGVEAGRVMDKDSLFDSRWFGLVPDTTGGAIVTWPRYLPSDSSQIWAQHLSAAGLPCWDTGVCISEYASYNGLPLFRTTTDAKDGAIGCWRDLRFDWPYWSVYAQRYGDAPGGVAESHVGQPGARLRMAASIARDVLFVQEDARYAPQVGYILLDLSGRKIMALHPGPNDVRTLAAGVYFVKEAQAVRKVVVTR